MTNPLVCGDSEYFTKGYPIFVCGAPAWASLKAIKGHTEYYSCERCEIREYHDGSVCILGMNGKCRTDKDFALQVCNEHHKGFSA